MNVETLVAGVDFSETSRAACRWAVRQFAAEASVILVHVLEVPHPPGFLRGLFPPRKQLLRTAREEAAARLDELASELTGSGRERPETTVREGRPAPEIAALAEETEADLVVVGRHGERRGDGRLLGSTAEQLVRFSRPPVLLANGRAEDAPRSLLVPVDDSDEAPRVLAWGKALRERFGAELTLLHVVVSLRIELRYVSSEGEKQETDDAVESETLAWLRELASHAGLDPEALRLRVATGNPTQEILSAAERLDTDLLVLGSRGAGRIERALTGSVARDVIRGASVPLLIVTPGEED